MSFYLYRILLDIPGLMSLGRNRRLPTQETDLGYLTHCALLELFGDDAPKPFAVPRTLGRWAEVLGYGTQAPEHLREHAQTFAKPQVYSLVRWEEWSHKPMPQRWPVGRQLGFDVRACPVVRKSKGIEGRCRAGAEVDAFLTACWEADEDTQVNREAVYQDWLAKQVQRRGGAVIVQSGLKAFQRQRLLRRAHDKKRRSKVLERPDALMSGVLEITDSESFARLLQTGLGRHRSFGFGMVLLRPVPR
jgi:CRISPR system Cascade subunit CasE